MRVGDRFGRWTVLDPQVGGVRACCRCVCGTERLVPRNNLTSGVSNGCAACAYAASRGQRKFFAGQTINGWLVLRDVDRDTPSRQRYVEARCPRCEREMVMSIGSLRRRNGGCATCLRADRFRGSLAGEAALLRTTLTRQGIHARVMRGWTPQEAGTLPRGQTPDRLLETRNRRKAG